MRRSTFWKSRVQWHAQSGLGVCLGFGGEKSGGKRLKGFDFWVSDLS